MRTVAQPADRPRRALPPGRASRSRPPGRSMAVVTLSNGGAGTSQAEPDRAARLGDCLERARNGEMGALGDVVRELNPLLWRVARAEGLTAEESADVVQTTWLELLRRLRGIQSPRALTARLRAAARPRGGGARGPCPRPGREGGGGGERGVLSRSALGDVGRERTPLVWRVARAEGLTAEESADVVQTTGRELLRRLRDTQSPRALPAWLVPAPRRGAWRARELSRR